MLYISRFHFFLVDDYALFFNAAAKLKSVDYYDEYIGKQ